MPPLDNSPGQLPDSVAGPPSWETTPETSQFCRWHHEKAPDGQLFVLPIGPDGKPIGPTYEELAEDGWVDNPGKLGLNVWGAKDSLDRRLAQMAADYEAGDISPLDTPSFAPQQIKKLRSLTDEQREQLEAAKQRQRVLQEENERLKAEMAAWEAARTPETPIGRDALQTAQEEDALNEARKQKGPLLDVESIAKRSARGDAPTGGGTPPADPDAGE